MPVSIVLVVAAAPTPCRERERGGNVIRLCQKLTDDRLERRVAREYAKSITIPPFFYVLIHPLIVDPRPESLLYLHEQRVCWRFFLLFSPSRRWQFDDLHAYYISIGTSMRCASMSRGVTAEASLKVPFNSSPKRAVEYTMVYEYDQHIFPLHMLHTYGPNI